MLRSVLRTAHHAPPLHTLSILQLNSFASPRFASGKRSNRSDWRRSEHSSIALHSLLWITHCHNLRQKLAVTEEWGSVAELTNNDSLCATPEEWFHKEMRLVDTNQTELALIHSPPASNAANAREVTLANSWTVPINKHNLPSYIMCPIS